MMHRPASTLPIHCGLLDGARAAWLALVGIAAGCSSPASTAPPPQDPPTPVIPEPVGPREVVIAKPAAASSPRECTRQPFVTTLPLAEASGAVYVPDAQQPYLLVVGDSGNSGQMLEVDPESGQVLRKGRLPLDKGASDDLEGLAVVGDVVYGITSSGWMRHWRRVPPTKGKDKDGEVRYELVRTAYPIAPPRGSPALVCESARDINCGRNYEGMCLRNPARTGAACAGFAASKTDGVLYCLVFTEDGTLAAEPGRAISVARADALSGCDFAPDDDTVWVGTNLFGGNRVSTVTGWDKPESARVESVGILGTGFGEAIAVGPGQRVYRFSDTSSAQSLVDKYVCE